MNSLRSLSLGLAIASLGACAAPPPGDPPTNDPSSAGTGGIVAGGTGGAGAGGLGSGGNSRGGTGGVVAAGSSNGGTTQGGTSNGGAGSSGASNAGAAAAGSSNGGAPAGGSSAGSPLGGSSNGGDSMGGSPGGAGSAGTVSGGAGGTAGSLGIGGSGPTGTTFRVSGRQLYDRCGEAVVLRGVNEMIVWSDGKDGAPEFAEIAKTGANVVRIVWTDEGSAAELDRAIENAVAQKLIPMPEHHAATGDLSKVPNVVDYWTRSDVVTVLKRHEQYLLLNIANEAGATVTQSDFENTYRTAITRIRETGLKVPLVIDGPQWGQDIDMLQAAGPALIQHDPEKNLLFSVHMWWSDANGTRVTSELDQSVEMNLPLIVGEFAQHAVAGCSNAPFAYRTLLAEAQRHRIGWLAWSWGAVDNSDCSGQGSFDMTVGGVFGNWEETWGRDVAVDDQNSIQLTSVRPASMVNGSCSP